MELNAHIVAFKKGTLVCPDHQQDNKQLVATVNAELMNLGYALTENAFKQLAKSDEKFITEWAQEIVNYLANVMGTGHFTPFHEGFPQSVKAMSELELYLNALLHYWTQGAWKPVQVDNKVYAYEHTEYNTVDSIEDITGIFTKLAAMGTAPTPEDAAILNWFLAAYSKEEIKAILPKEIPFKETLCRIVGAGIPIKITRPTDVMRVAMFLSNGTTDLILPPQNLKGAWDGKKTINPLRQKAHFGPFSNAQRRLLLGLLDKCAFLPEMIALRGRWLKLGKLLHPRTQQNTARFPKAAAVFEALRNRESFANLTWNSKVQEVQNFEDLAAGLRILQERPGEFARRLDSLLRSNLEQTELILGYFAECSARVSNKVLFELLTHFKGREIDQDVRTVFIKGSRKPTALPLLKALPAKTVASIESMIWTILTEKFAKLPAMGKVYLDEELKKIPLPKNMRTLTQSTKPVIRGQRTPFTTGKDYVRFYCHWIDADGGEDLDLSANLVNLETRATQHVGFNNLRINNLKDAIVHSGDVINRKGKCAEYIDFHFEAVSEVYTHALMVVNNFRGRGFDSVPNFFGFMEREKPESNLTWYPKTVVNAFTSQSQSSRIAVCAIDFRTREWILVDQDMNGIPVSQPGEIAEYINLLSEMPKVSCYDLLQMHVAKRGEQVDTAEAADKVFTFADFSTDYAEIAKYML